SPEPISSRDQKVRSTIPRQSRTTDAVPEAALQPIAPKEIIELSVARAHSICATPSRQSVVPTSAASSPGAMTQGEYQIGASRLSSKKERSATPADRVTQRGTEIGRLDFCPSRLEVCSAISPSVGFEAGAMSSRCVPA